MHSLQYSSNSTSHTNYKIAGVCIWGKKIRNKSHKSWTYLFDMQYGFALRNADIEMWSRKVSFNNPTLQTQTKPNVL